MGDITTAARRMTRAVNAMTGEPRTWHLYFDAAGNTAGQREPQSLGTPAHEWQIPAGQDRRTTLREVQDMIDARDGLGRFLATASPAELEEAGYA